MHWLALYYSQTGQTRRALEEIATPLVEAGHTLDWRAIEPVEPYPFPWPQRRFWGVAGECHRGEGCAIRPLELPATFDAVLFGAQPWFLAPSPPVMGFLNSPGAEQLRGRPVYPVITCRAAWRRSYQIVRAALLAHGAILPARLILKDRAPTPLNIITTVYHLWWGGDLHDQTLGRPLPPFGISPRGWRRARRFGLLLATREPAGGRAGSTVVPHKG
ncbi:MAG: hypothetical protein COZ96_00560 [Nitrospirae bacterium CG_4_8_14_3_um_filter_70_85]|nr:MAG: hypothetical protein COZ96_00560 [Nitrospirae bacterium CG_4_8_14_3_um_filter_70_85]PIX83987.1 MAG: hypothetical protein COZ33_02585 [Nitrospirae bacterium CG_4_10_14_3_um_filter_70_108]PJB96111.1 MAG: hypothetical protein CO080_04215 [Nitrospirae bacterium CG_4_9_14_0_8_um_filter_70_14]